jgi:hypothetical protein
MKKLNLSSIRKKFNFIIQKNSSLELMDLVNQSYGDVLDCDVFLPSIGINLQRKLVWTTEQKQDLILSVLKGIEIASVSVIIYKDNETRKTNSMIIKVIDGKQRISTLISFVKNEFPIVFEGVEYFYDDLETDAQYIFLSFTFRCDRVYEYDYKPVSDQDKIDWFEMINFSGTPQDKEHMLNLKKKPV